MAPRRVLLAIAVIVLIACATVPITGRKQLSLIPAGEMLGMSAQQYGTFLKDAKLSKNAEQTALVRKVGVNIQKSVERYMQRHGLSDQLAGYKWEFNLVESDEVNAWCMPGGKVVVYSGLLPVTKDEAGLAVVLGHEIAHAIAEHGNERVSQGLLAQLGGVALAVAIKDKPQQTQQLWMTAFGAGAQFGVLLPFSRLQESEADRLGLIFMAMAGYNPKEARDFWKRMSSQASGQKPPEFLSTHPSDETRIAKINEHLGEAMKYYKAALKRAQK